MSGQNSNSLQTELSAIGPDPKDIQEVRGSLIGKVILWSSTIALMSLFYLLAIDEIFSFWQNHEIFRLENPLAYWSIVIFPLVLAIIFFVVPRYNKVRNDIKLEKG